ncbi:MAG TPA: hypothetical protein VN442_20765, partial [Bryobacteraceae bacterium]|nr:hypothetical protein [Bryobacteraceae bacterium]
GFHRGGGFIGGFHGGRGGFRSHIGFGGGFNRFGFRSGFGFNRGFGFRRGFGFNTGFYLPYSYAFPIAPLYPYGYGSPYVWDYGWDYPSYISYPPEQAYAPPAPPVIIRQQYASPVIRESSPLIQPYVAPEQPLNQPAADRSAIYLIAFTDNVIRPAMAYWVEGGTLHYLGLDHKERQAPLDTVDRGFSTRLNRERRVPFRLPEP